MKTDLDNIFDAIKGLTRRKKTGKSETPEPEGATFLIVGLGNPGREFKNTRHNIGFMLVDRLAQRMNVDFSRSQSKALVTDGRYQGYKILLAKPQTFMNKSGHPTRALLKFYKLSLENFLVVYDDVDLPFETLRIKPSGSSGGHKGMESIIKQLGSSDFPRLRLGIGRPPGSQQAADYVLKPFKKQEVEFLENYLARAADAVQTFIDQGIEYTMNQYN
jgi:PTH1 family peptidyl-tRNA hydrolase